MTLWQKVVRVLRSVEDNAYADELRRLRAERAEREAAYEAWMADEIDHESTRELWSAL